MPIDTQMLDLEIHGSERFSDPQTRARIERLCALALSSAAVRGGHLAIEFVDAARIAELNEEHRGKRGPTDVLSFPIDGAEHGVGSEREPPRELGDVVICLEHTADVEEAILHGVLHLLGMDHETDDGEMLALQAELLRWMRSDEGAARRTADRHD